MGWKYDILELDYKKKTLYVELGNFQTNMEQIREKWSNLIETINLSPSEPSTVRQHLLHPSQQQTQYCLLDILMAVYRGRQWLAQQLEHVHGGPLGQPFAQLYVFTGYVKVHFFVYLRHVVRDEDGPWKMEEIEKILDQELWTLSTRCNKVYSKHTKKILVLFTKPKKR